MSVPFHFKFTKALQAASVLLRRAGPTHTENYMKILKLLYLADRESLARSGRPITGDRPVAMKHGPVLSHVLDLIRDRALNSPEWAKWIGTDRYNIYLKKDPGNSELSRFEIDLLHEIWERYKDLDPWETREATHDLPEWVKNQPQGNSSQPIPLADILEAVGRQADNASIEAEAAASAYFDGLLGE